MGEGLATAQFLEAAVDASRRLAELHEASRAHGSLTPAWLGSWTARWPPADPWAYRAPEQTGRLQRPVDERSDLYSLGVIFYELLTGSLPFTADDPLGWTHGHLAVPPRSPRELDPQIPAIVETIVLRLLEKEPGDRYQTAAGLLHDLERCRDEWARGHGVEPFALGAHDQSGRLAISQRLYGRTRERRALLGEFAAVHEGDGPRVAVIRGNAGVGKSALVRELAAPVAAAGGFLLAGKFDDSPRGPLYGPIAAGFGELVRLILAGPESALTAWRELIQGAVGDNAQLLTDVVPELERVIGPQPPTPALPFAEAHHRFAHTFSRFVAAFATYEHPLVLFVDDVHWADEASLRLLADLAGDRSLHSLLLVVATRPDGANESGLARVVNAMRHVGVRVHEIEVGPLADDAVAQLLADTFALTPAECRPLQAVLSEKTGGNPLFVGQLLLDLYGAGLVRYDRRALTWQWDLGGVRRRSFGDSVVGLLTDRLAACPVEVQRTLSLAACLGSSFDPALLARVGSEPDTQTALAIDGAVRAGLIVRAQDGYRFSHDRVREAAYAAMPVQQGPSTHLRIGRVLLAEGADVVDAVAQLDQGRSAVTEPRERRELARLNLLASRRARSAAAFDAVSEDCAAGLELLGVDGWTTDREVVFGLTLGLAEAELFAGNGAAAEQLLSAAIEHAETRRERTACARLWIDLKTAAGAIADGLAYVFEVVASYGAEISVAPEHAEAAERSLHERLGDDWERVLLDLPLGEDSEIAELLDLLVRAGPQASIVEPRMFRLIACIVIDLTLTHGLFSASLWGLTAYGFDRSVVGDHARGDRFADIALELADRHRLVAHLPAICTILAARIWTRKLADVVEIAREGVRVGIERGDVHNASMCSVFVGLNRLIAGAPLAEVERNAEDGLDVARRVGLAGEAGNLIVFRQLVRALQGTTDRLSVLTSGDFDQRALTDTLEANAGVGLAWWFHTYELEAQVFGGAFTKALRTREKLDPMPVWMQGTQLTAEAEFFGALAIAGCDPELRRAHVARLFAAAKQLSGWAELCPGNFAHRAAILNGERARFEGRPSDALELFEVAVARAQIDQVVHIEALAHESAARLCRELRLEPQAERHRRAAIDCYRQWGAMAKVRQLEHDAYPAAAVSQDEVDALAVARAAQAIAREVEHGRVLERLLETAIMQAGARGGVLLLARGEAMVVAASAETRHGGVEVTIHRPAREPSSGDVPETVVNYVSRTEQPLIVGDTAVTEPFARDPYVVKRGVRSLLCVPMLAQRELRGLLCVENDLIIDAFTSARLVALDVITAQAVISLENAHSRDQLRAIAEEQASLHRIAALVAHGAEPKAVFDAVCAEAALVFDAPFVNLSQPRTDGSSVTVARVERYEATTSDTAVEAPVTVDGRLWGVLQIGKSASADVPLDTEQRLTAFSDLVATAISNAAARSALVASRARIVSAGDEARRRIERNLHDGVQQQLITLGLNLQMLDTLIPAGTGEAHDALARIKDDVISVFDAVGQISRGLHPAALRHGGLRTALAALARTSPIAVRTNVVLDARLPEPVEICTYYVVSEALTNAGKHSGAESVSLDVRLDDGVLSAVIADAGAGGADTSRGSGLIGLTDRVEALGGRLIIDSPLTGGTRIEMELPV